MRYSIIPVTPLQQNCTLIWCEETKAGAVIDAGGEIDRILKVAEKNGVTIEKLLVTHGHFDHAGAVADLRDRLGVPVEGPHKGDAFWIEAMERQCEMFGFPPLRSFTPDRWLEDGDTVTLGKVTLEVLHCPGHTPGHVIFHDRPTKVAQVGDVLFKGSIGRTDFPRGDHDTLIASIREKLWPLGDDVTFIPGHGPTSTFGYERRTNPFVGG